jgi:hypothetical protein
MKTKKGSSKAATGGLFSGLGSKGGAGSSAKTEPRRQGFLDGQASEAPAPQAVVLPQPPAAHSLFGGMGGMGRMGGNFATGSGP